MFRRILLLYVVIFSSTVSIAHAQISKQVAVRALVAADSAGIYINVKDLSLDFVFTGIGMYLPSDYPIVTELPLENGERIRFDKIREATFQAVRVSKNEYIEPAMRHKYSTVDKRGYRHWSDVEVDVWVKDWDGNELKSRIFRPPHADIFLRGETTRGNFKLQLDIENEKLVHVMFRPNFVMQCTEVKSHIFPNMDYQFCPYCGKPLHKLTPENVKK